MLNYYLRQKLGFDGNQNTVKHFQNSYQMIYEYYIQYIFYTALKTIYIYNIVTIKEKD